MLIRATVENFLSFNDRAEVLLTPGRTRNLPEHIIPAASRRDVGILKSAVIYGANASGKSNFTKALLFLKRLVTSRRSSSFLHYEKFKLDRQALERPSRMEVEFHYRGHNYAYGFVFDRRRIYEEWLYRFDKQRDWKLFERKTEEDQVEVAFEHLEVSAKNLDRLRFIGADTLPHELFLTASNHRNIKDIKGVFHLLNAYNWFDEALTVIFPDSKFMGLEINIDSDQAMRQVYQWFLSAFETGISGLETFSVDFFSNEVKLPDEIKERIAQNLEVGERAMISSIDNITYSLIRKENGDIDAVKLMTKHKIKGSDEYATFEVNEESDGTQRIMDFIPAIVELAREDKVFVIDEINRSLHPNLTAKLFELFFQRSKGVRSQLICTTHESELLDQQLLRKDEIWFVRKNADGESALYSLEEFSQRKDVDIRTGYLKGRYEAIPSFSFSTEAPWGAN